MSADLSAEGVADGFGRLPPPETDWSLELSWNSSGPLALAHFRFIFPELAFYKGGCFLADRFDESNVDTWLKGHPLAATEAVVNHIHLGEDQVFGDNAVSVDEAYAIGRCLAYGWKIWARDRYGATIYPSLYQDEPHDWIITFTSQPPGVAG